MIRQGCQERRIVRLGKTLQDEQAIQECVDKAKEDIGYLQRSKDRKQSIDSLS